MVRAPAVLAQGTRARLAAGLALGALLIAYYVGSESLPDISTWWEVAFLGAALIPAVFALVVLALPLRRARGVGLVGAALLALAFVLMAANLDVAANYAKLGAMTALGFWFLNVFESIRWVVVVAALIPLVDAVSVWRGPTHHIVTEQPELFTTLSFAFPVPGEHASANLGLPDLLFFAVFLAATERFGLRPFWTWLAMTASFGITMALVVWTDVAGLPALPGLSIAFLLVNADRLWRQLRVTVRSGADTSPS